MLKLVFYSFITLFSFSILWIACNKEEVNTKVSITGINFELNTLTLEEGEKKSIIATISPKEATKDITKNLLNIANSNTDVVVVSIDTFMNSEVTISVEAKKIGKASLILSIKNIAKKDTIEVLVNAKDGGGVKVTKISLNKKELLLTKGKKDTLSYTADPDNAKDTTVTWTSSNEEIATVNAKGEVTGIAIGEADIVARSNSSPTITGACKVVVIIPVTRMHLNLSSLVLEEGKSSKLKAIIEPEDAINKNITWSSSNENIVTVSDDGTVTAKGKAGGEALIIANTEDGNKIDTCEVRVISSALAEIIASGKIPSATELASYQNPFVRELFVSYKSGATLIAKYIKENNVGDGTSWQKADSSAKAVLDGIIDASADKVYIVLIGIGRYLHGYFSMKNNVLIVGGFTPDTYERSTSPTDTTVYTSGLTNDGSMTPIDSTAGLYGITIMESFKTGMQNINASPKVQYVDFIENDGGNRGGGMYNENSSPILKHVNFIKNYGSQGVGIFNTDNSHPQLEYVNFIENGGSKYGSTSIAIFGSGVYNKEGSTISLNKGIFFKNFASQQGGAIYMDVDKATPTSSTKLYNVSFIESSSTDGGGAIYVNAPNIVSSNTSILRCVNTTFYKNKNSNNDGKGSAIYIKGSSGKYEFVNSVFWQNSNDVSSTSSDASNQIYFDKSSSGVMQVNLYNSIFSGGVGTIVSGTALTDVNQGGFASVNSGTGKIAVYYDNIGIKDPLIQNTGNVFSIPSNSLAVNKGLYVAEESGKYYYSIDKTSWYTDLTNPSGSSESLPATAIEITKSDQNGNVRQEIPDIGAFETK